MISAHEVINKISSTDSSYIVDVVILPNFSNSIISIGEVAIT